ncbi:MAG: hypothetical protein AAGF12_00200, partial [Myxococcota bacterium]
LEMLELCCRNILSDPWEEEHRIAKDIQLPFAPIHPSIGTVADARDLIGSRLIDGERVEFGEFERLFSAISDTRTLDVPLRSICQRHGQTSLGIETQVFGNAMALSLLPEWRRGLGFGYFDPADELTFNEAYDYRITGEFLSRDLHDVRHEFTAVPLGTSLPGLFRTGAVLWVPGRQTMVVSRTPPNGKAFETLHKGIRPRLLTLILPAPTRFLAVDLFGSVDVAFSHRGSTVHSVTLSPSGRTQLTSPALFDSVRIRGEMFISAVIEQPRVHGPTDVETREAVLRNVVFYDSPGPRTAERIEAGNLQNPVSAQREQHMAGFRVAIDPTDTPWPVDLPYAPPLDSAHFILERAGSDGAFRPYDSDAGLIVGARQLDLPTPSEGPGIDIERRFSSEHRPAAHSRWVEIDDTLQSIIKGKRANTPYGESFTYRVTTVDPIGRRSAPLDASPQRLEKHLPPPIPGGPIDRGADPRAGVRVRVLQRHDPRYPLDQEAFRRKFPRDAKTLDRRDVAIVLEWGWAAPAEDGEPPTERDRDPFVREFRIYFRANDYNSVGGRVLSTRRDGDFFEISVELEESVAENALVGQSIGLPHPFRIVSHGAGSRIAIRVDESTADDTAQPRAGSFRLSRSDRDGGGPPTSWDRRIAIQPIDDPRPMRTSYSLVLDGDLITIDADGPSIRGYLGVTAADDQRYVTDTISSGPLAGRWGNESYAASAPILAEYFGRPEVPSTELLEVDRRELRLLRGNDLRFEFRAEDWGPPGWVAGDVRIQRVSGDAIARRVRRVDVEAWVDTDTDESGVRIDDATPDLLDQIRRGRIEDLWLATIANRYELTSLWTTVYQGPLRPHIDSLPNVPGRWFYRVQASDAKGRTSVNAWLAPVAVVVPDRSRPLVPELSPLEALSDAEVNVQVTVDLLGANPQAPTILLFATEVTGATPPEVGARLLTVKNRADLDPSRTHRVRTDDGDLIVPVTLSPDGASTRRNEDRGVDQLVWDVPVTRRSDAEVQVWVASFRNGTTSTLIGPRRLPASGGA